MTQDDERLSGYTEWRGRDAFEDHNGPFFYKETREGCACAFVVEEKHLNEGGFAHGGLLATFADYSSFMTARNCFSDGGATTVSLNTDFSSAARLGDLVESRCEVVQETKGMVFMRGTLVVGERIVVSFSCLIKKLRKR